MQYADLITAMSMVLFVSTCVIFLLLGVASILIRPGLRALRSRRGRRRTLSEDQIFGRPASGFCPETTDGPEFQDEDESDECPERDAEVIFAARIPGEWEGGTSPRWQQEQTEG
jgi:hypothetical protein